MPSKAKKQRVAVVTATEFARRTSSVRKLASERTVLVTQRGRVVAVLTPTSLERLVRDVPPAELASGDLFIPAQSANRSGLGGPLAAVIAGHRRVLTEYNRPVVLMSPPVDDLDRAVDRLGSAFEDVDVELELRRLQERNGIRHAKSGAALKGSAPSRRSRG